MKSVMEEVDGVTSALCHAGCSLRAAIREALLVCACLEHVYFLA